MWFTKPAGPWRDRRALLFVTVSLISGFGSTVMMLVAGIWVLSLTGSASLAALANLGVYLPTLFAPVLGVLVDRLSRRSVLVWTNTLTAGAVLTLLVVDSTRWVWLIFAVMLWYGVCLVLVDAADAALVPSVLPAESLGAVNGLRISAQEGTKLVAPLVGAALFAWRGGPMAVTVTVLALLAAAGLYALVGAEARRPLHSGPDHAESRLRQLRDDIRAGIDFVRRTPVVRAPVLVGSVAIAMSAFATAGWYAVVTQDLHRPPAFLGVLTSVQGVGSILAGLLAGRLMARYGEATIGACGAVVLSVGAVGWMLSWWPTVVAGSLLAGLGLPWTLVAAVTTVQRRTPSEMLGRAAATANTLLFAPIAVATPLGSAAALVERRLPIAVAAVVSLTAGLLLLTGVRRARSSGGAPTRRRISWVDMITP
mgnify:CR=1 FL=1